MDDLSEKLDRLLSSPDSMKRIEEMMAAFGGMPSPAPPEEAPIEPALPLPVMGADGLDLGKILQFLPLIEQFRKEDDTALLLKALRPFLAAERQKRLDEAGQFLKIARLLPLITEQFAAKGRDDHD
ncbi:MAG: hypothetical protein IJC52_05680 [Clostridia bacterium]|nr:hypothetical protein [Clostridia bacterium]